MLGQAASLGCPDLDVACLCNNINFRYGIRDCAFEHCQDVDLANQVISFGNEECSCKSPFLSPCGGICINILPAAGVPYPEPSATATLTVRGRLRAWVSLS